MQLILQEENGTRTVEVEEGATILDALQRAGVTSVHSPCGGGGTCLKCTVTVRGGGLNGPCLACQTKVADGMTVVLAPEVKMEVQQSGKCAVYPPDGGGKGFGVACDIGTTTVVCHLLDLKTGRRLATVGAANAQKVFGADVIARIQASVEGKLKLMTEAIQEQLSGMIEALCRKTDTDIKQVRYMTIAGNTVMSHLFAELAPDSIGVAPFAPLSLFGTEHDAKEMGLPFDGTVYITPSVAGYVGGDITADVLATELVGKEKPTLMLDIGTNGEMVLGCGEKFVCCATAAGPAFEGANIKQGMPASPGAISEVTVENGRLKVTVLGSVAPTGICGSGLVDALAVMLDLGAVDETGRLLDADEAPEEALPYLDEDDDGNVFKLTEDGSVCVTQADVREIQLAKASIAAGIRVMAERYGVALEEIDALVLAGGFGSFIRPRSAARIGLIPPVLLDVTRAVGNAAGEGAVSAALSAKARTDLQKIQQDCAYIELSSDSAFNDAYIEEMMFEEA
ncbi:MAG: DUF4445 domain-containing protein [Oscillospiraceae bacterium]|nr:DUF4445 domain-containing protein [Oscillospiraceae bacterium]